MKVSMCQVRDFDDRHANEVLRLCRSMCGKPLLFRPDIIDSCGFAAAFLRLRTRKRRQSREECGASRRSRASPQIDGQSPEVEVKPPLSVRQFRKWQAAISRPNSYLLTESSPAPFLHHPKCKQTGRLLYRRILTACRSCRPRDIR